MHTRKIKKSGSVKTFGNRRICKKNGCKQRLSAYNSEEYCHVHRAEIS